MKAPRPKIHLADRDSPILDYSNVEVRCEAVLQHAEPKFMFAQAIAEEGQTVEIVASMQVCRKCSRLDSPESSTKSYLYGLVEAQEERDAERQAES